MTGLSAAIKTKAPIYESSDKCGGICKSYVKEGFHFSVGGGHWLFGEGKGLDYISSQVDLNKYERRASVFVNKFFDYPIQTYVKKPCMAHPDTLKHWLIQSFGPELFNMFHGPFNEKYTAGMYEKVVQTDQYKSPPAGGKGFCSYFYDPTRGLDDLVEKMAAQCHITYKRQVVRVHTDRKRVEFNDGGFKEYDKLISTIPLNSLVRMCGKEVNLPFTSALVINIGAVPGKLCPTDHWVYVPFCKSGFYRVGFYSNVSADKSPDGKVSLSVEMAFLPENKPNREHLEKICFDVIEELQDWGWIGEVIVCDPTWVACAYTWEYNKGDAQKEIEWLKSKDIISTGRYGSWRFCGMKESIEMGFAV